MENLIVWLIVACAAAYSINGLVKTWKGDGGCSCGPDCSGCSDRQDTCNFKGPVIK